MSLVGNKHAILLHRSTAMPSAGLPELGPALVHPLSVSMKSRQTVPMSLSRPLSELEK